MYAKATRYAIKPGMIEEAQELSRHLLPAAAIIPGLKELLNLQRDDGKGILIEIYENADEAARAEPAVRHVWDQFRHLYSEATISDGYDVRGRAFIEGDGGSEAGADE